MHSGRSLLDTYWRGRNWKCLAGPVVGPEWTPRSTTQRQRRIDRSMDGELEIEAMGIDDNDTRI